MATKSLVPPYLSEILCTFFLIDKYFGSQTSFFTDSFHTLQPTFDRYQSGDATPQTFAAFSPPFAQPAHPTHTPYISTLRG